MLNAVMKSFIIAQPCMYSHTFLNIFLFIINCLFSRERKCEEVIRLCHRAGFQTRLPVSTTPHVLCACAHIWPLLLLSTQNTHTPIEKEIENDIYKDTKTSRQRKSLFINNFRFRHLCQHLNKRLFSPCGFDTFGVRARSIKQHEQLKRGQTLFFFFILEPSFCWNLLKHPALLLQHSFKAYFRTALRSQGRYPRLKL